MLPYWAVPRCWPGECVAVLAGGGSLTRQQVEHVRGKCRVVAITRSFELAPWADWLWACDADGFWALHPEATAFAGTRIVIRPCGHVSSTPANWSALARLADSGVKVLRHTGRDYPSGPQEDAGLSADPAVVRGNNSLHQFLSVVAHTGASTVVLLGADQRPGRWHPGYRGQPTGPDHARTSLPNFATLVAPLEAAGVSVLNATPGSALPWEPVLLEDAMP